MQIIKYKWLLQSNRFEPSFFTFDNNEIKRLEILGKNLSVKIGKRLCIGHFRKGRYIECPHKRILENTYCCNECRLNDDFFMCMRCDGSECINKKQRSGCMENVYFVYIAAFDSLLKVGISHERRLIERLIEQGADFAAKIAVVKDGKDVRSIEQEIKRHLAIHDSVSGEEKQRMLFCNPNRSIECMHNAISALNNGVSNLIKNYIVPPEIYDLRDYYGLGNVEYAPKKFDVKENSRIEGEAIAAKGNIIIFRNSSLFSFNAHELIGREIEIN